MRKFLRITCILLICMFTISLMGCGGKSSESTDSAVSSAATAVSNESANDSAKGNTAVPLGTASVESLLGSWVGVDDETRFANVTKTDAGYQFEDNDGKYPGQFNEGVLQIKVTETDLADIYFNSSDSTLVLDFQGDVVKYKKK